MARRLQAAAGAADLVARYGGDEFAVVLAQGTTVEQAAAAADRFRAELAAPMQVGDVVLTVGCSVGMSMTTDPQMDVLGLVEQADRDMYRDKSRSVGRLARPDRPPPLRPAPVPAITLRCGAIPCRARWPHRWRAGRRAPYWAIPWSGAADPVPPVRRSAMPAEQERHAVVVQVGTLGGPWRRTPVRFRWWWFAMVAAVIAALAALALWAPGPDLAHHPHPARDAHPARPDAARRSLSDDAVDACGEPAGRLHPVHAAGDRRDAGLRPARRGGVPAGRRGDDPGAADGLVAGGAQHRVVGPAGCGRRRGASILLTGSHDWTEPVPVWAMLPLSAVLGRGDRVPEPGVDRRLGRSWSVPPPGPSTWPTGATSSPSGRSR